MVNRIGFLLLSSVLAVTGCGQQQPQQRANPQYQTQNAPINPANPNIDCSPIVNPNYVPGGNQAQYYYPEGCQTTANNMGYNNMGYNNGYNNGSNIGGYVGAAAVGAAAGALANRAINNRNKNQTSVTTTNPTNTPTYNPAQNNRTYTPTYNRNSTVYRKGTVNNRVSTRTTSRRR